MEDLAPVVPVIPSDCGHWRPAWRIPLMVVLCSPWDSQPFPHVGSSSSCFCTGTRRTVPMDHTFFPGYRKTLLSPEEILLSIEIPYSREVRCWQWFQALLKWVLLPGSRQRDQNLPQGPTWASLNLYIDDFSLWTLPLLNQPYSFLDNKKLQDRSPHGMDCGTR